MSAGIYDTLPNPQKILTEHMKSLVSYYQPAISLICEPHREHQLMGRANVALIERRWLECG